MSVVKEKTTRTNTKKRPERSQPRYFDVSINESEVVEVPLKKPKRKGISKKVIKVSLTEKPLKYAFRRKFKRKETKIPIDQEALKKHSRGQKSETSGVKTKYFKEKIKRKEVYFEYANEQAARTEILRTEQQGYLIPDEEERTVDCRQEDIIKNVDITAATKHFNLNLDFGPYRHRYTKNGRHLLIGGRMGHVAAFDWVRKKLHCEMNVMEEVADVSWLHIETMFACAQKNWVYFYDNRGVEIHCVKRMYRVNKLEFLPYHFLLAAGSSEGFLSWLDVSIGELIGHYNSKLGNIRILKQNPATGVLCIGGGNGVVSMWSPKVREPLAKMLCHSTPISALAVSPNGAHLVTSGLDRTVKVWDIRELNGPLEVYNIKMPANEIDISQKDILALSMGNVCEIYNNVIMANKTPYLRHRTSGFIHSLRFCPYEDVLGLATDKGFSSLLVPGSGEPNFDALEDNPFQTKSQRREHEVHALLEKIPPEFITLDPNEITSVDVETLKDKVEAKKNILFVKPPQIDFKSRRKMKGKGGSAKAAKNKQIVRDSARKEFVKEVREAKKELIKEHQDVESNDFIPLELPSALSRFKAKKKRRV